MGKRGISDAHQVIWNWRPAVMIGCMFAFFWFGGLTKLWDWGPYGSGLFVAGMLWAIVVALAIGQGTLDMKNLGFIVGDLALAVAIGVSTLTFEYVPGIRDERYMFNHLWFAIGFVILGYLVCLYLEYSRIWSKPGHAPVQMSDWWHHGFFGPMAYWVAYALVVTIAGFIESGMSSYMSIVLGLVVIFLIVWLLCVGLQVKREVYEGRHYGHRTFNARPVGGSAAVTQVLERP